MKGTVATAADITINVSPEIDNHTEFLLLKGKYEKLLLHNNVLQKTNQELEEKLLNAVEKIEQDKIVLSIEIDHLAERLANATNVSDFLRHECARYKSDCMLAVHLLQCQPAYYAQKKVNLLSEDLQKQIAAIVDPEENATSKIAQKRVSMPAHMTFPPTAVFLRPSSVEEEAAPPEPSCSPQSTSKIPEIFVKSILDQSDYQTPKLHQCPKCGVSVPKMDQSTQTFGSTVVPITSAVGHVTSGGGTADGNGNTADRAEVHHGTNVGGTGGGNSAYRYNANRTMSGDSNTSTETAV